jgi:hypothetical protein
MMGRSKLIEITVLGVWLLIAVLFFFKTKLPHKDEIVLPEGLNTDTFSSVDKGKDFDLRKIVLMEDGRFDLTLKDDASSRILADLTVQIVKGSRGKVLDFLNIITKPRVLLRERKSDGKWLVDVFVVADGKELNLADWLKDNNLAYK